VEIRWGRGCNGMELEIIMFIVKLKEIITEKIKTRTRT